MCQSNMRTEGDQTAGVEDEQMEVFLHEAHY